MRKSFAKKYGPWALVTGATSGIGLEIARQLAEQGLNIVLASRRQSALIQTAGELRGKYNIDVRIVSVDFAIQGAAQTLADSIADLDIGLVVPSAGIEETGEYIAHDLSIHNTLNQINVVAPTELAHIYGRKLAERGSGGLLLVSSLLGYQGTPLFASYAAGKAYILTLGEALHVELARHGVDVTVLSPGLTSTSMVANMPVNWSKMPLIKLEPETVAKVGLDALGRKASVVPGLLNKFYAFENRLMPRIWPTKLFGLMLRNAATEKAPQWSQKHDPACS